MTERFHERVMALPANVPAGESTVPEKADDSSRAANGAAGLPVLYDMDCAPLDGTLVQLLVRFDSNWIEDANEPTWTIGSHNDGEWNFVGWCWHRDEWARGSGDLLGWLPMGKAAGESA